VDTSAFRQERNGTPAEQGSALTRRFDVQLQPRQFVSVVTTCVKRAFKYRFHPTDAQAAELSRTFGCVRKVYNMALAARTEAWARQERVNYNQTSAMLTAWKKTEELAYLSEVSSVPLQQCLRHL
jgi:putative transposase